MTVWIDMSKPPLTTPQTKYKALLLNFTSQRYYPRMTADCLGSKSDMRAGSAGSAFWDNRLAQLGGRIDNQTTASSLAVILQELVSKQADCVTQNRQQTGVRGVE